VGDRLLIEIATRLRECRRSADTVARLGGDEFAILAEEIPNVWHAVHLAGRFQEALRRPFSVDGHEVFTTVSVGIALSSTSYTQPEEILRDADTALYRAKGAGRDRHEVVTSDRRDASTAGTTIDLAHSLDLEVVAEGVETREQLEFFRGQRCDAVQGFLLGVPASELPDRPGNGPDRMLRNLLD